MQTKFELEILPGAARGEYEVGVVESPSGNMDRAPVTLDMDSLSHRTCALEWAVRKSVDPAQQERAAAQHKEALRKLGVDLFEAVFSRPIAEAYHASRTLASERKTALQVVLRLVPPELAALPWEALYDPTQKNYLCFAEPVVRRVEAPFTTEPAGMPMPLRVLAVVAAPDELRRLDVDGEKRRLSEALSEPCAHHTVQLQWLSQASWSTLGDVFLKGPWHVLHFIGHGDYDWSGDSGRIALVGEDGGADWRDAADVAELLKDPRGDLRLVVLNSCASGVSGTHNVFSGVAATLVRSGVGAVVAMQFGISDAAAEAFQRGFYAALADRRRTIDEAVRDGRIAIKGRPASLEWVTPVLYVNRDTTNLLASPPPEQAERPQAAAVARLIEHLPERPALLPNDVHIEGRDQDTASALRLLAEATSLNHSAVPMVVVSGMPGVGKSAFAIHIAHILAKDFPDGQLFVKLRGADDKRALQPSDVLEDFLQALGVAACAIPAETSDRENLYRTRLSDKRVLVVLDDAGDEQQIRPLLPGSPSCAVLATSRKRLIGLEGAIPFTLRKLEPEAAQGMLARMVGGERALHERDAVAHVVKMCGYLPLAIQIAGARLKARGGFSIATYAARLDDEHRKLSELELEHLSVRACLTLGYNDLDSDDKRAFRMLGYLEAADFTVWRLAAVLDTDIPTAERRIESLLIAELIESLGPGVIREERFQIHDLLRLVARELLEKELRKHPSKRQEALHRAGASYLFLALRAAQSLEPGEDFRDIDSPDLIRPVDDPVLVSTVSQRPLDWFFVERASIVIVMDRAASAGFHRMALALWRCLPGFFDFRSHWGDWQKTSDIALASAQAIGDRSKEAAVLRSKARLARYRGELGLSGKLCKRSVEVARAAGDEGAEAESLIDLIRLSWYTKSYPEAHRAFTRAMRYFDRVGNQYGRARALTSIGMLLQAEDKAPLATSKCEQALDIFRTIKDTRWTASALAALADAYLDEAKLDEAKLDKAESCATQALDLLGSIGFRWYAAVVLRTLALVYMYSNRLPEAEALLDTAIRDLSELAMEVWTSRLQLSRAELRWWQGGNHLEDARADVAAAEGTLEKSGDAYRTGIARVIRSRIDHAQGKPVAVAEVCQAVDELHRHGDDYWEAQGKLLLAELMGGPGQDDRAAELRSQAEELLKRQPSRRGSAMPPDIRC